MDQTMETHMASTRGSSHDQGKRVRELRVLIAEKASAIAMPHDGQCEVVMGFMVDLFEVVDK